MFEIPSKYAESVISYAELDEASYAQIIQMVNHPCVEGSTIRFMPDCHAGAGCPIGTTMTLTDRVVPNLVGVDIGCGMVMYDLGPIDINFAELDQFIRNNIPSGFNVHSDEKDFCDEQLNNLFCKEYINIERARQSVGTLGGGNHFIEIDVDHLGNKFLIIHSGSRNVGLQVANYYQKLAIEKDRLGDKSLAYLSGDDMRHYLHDMQLMQDYAVTNRMAIGQRIKECLKTVYYDDLHTIHNYIDMDSLPQTILRKGAIRALRHERVLIPLNMADGSLVCYGYGNKNWNWSVPHGAGRVLSRRKAKEQINVEAFRERMDKAGVWTSCVNESTLDESPMAYKDTSTIIDAIGEAVEIIAHIKPVYNFKAN